MPSFCVLVCSAWNPFGNRKSLLLFLFYFRLYWKYIRKRRRKSRRFFYFSIVGHPTQGHSTHGRISTTCNFSRCPEKGPTKKEEEEQKTKNETKTTRKSHQRQQVLRAIIVVQMSTTITSKEKRRYHTRSIKPLDGVCPFSKFAALIDFIISITHRTQCTVPYENRNYSWVDFFIDLFSGENPFYPRPLPIWWHWRWFGQPPHPIFFSWSLVLHNSFILAPTFFALYGRR